MASNLPDDTATIAKFELLAFQLPLTQDQIKEQVLLFEKCLNTASDVLTSRGPTQLDLRVDITYLAPGQNLTRFLRPARVPMATDTADTTGIDEQSEPMTNAPMLPRPPMLSRPDHEADVGMPEAPPIDPTTITETDAVDAEGAPPDSPAPTPPRHQCKICMDDLTPEFTIMINCGCIYCGTCLNSHIMHGLSSRSHYPARCYSAAGIDVGDTAPYLTFEVILRWSEVEAEYKERMPMYCQNKECSAHMPEGRLESESKFINCNSCETDTCKECKQWRLGHSGEDLEIRPEDIVSKEDRELANSEKWSKSHVEHHVLSVLTDSQSSAPDARIWSNARTAVIICNANAAPNSATTVAWNIVQITAAVARPILTQMAGTTERAKCLPI